MVDWYRRQLEGEYGAEFVREMDEATLRLEAKDTPAFGPTGDCPCGGVLVYLCRQKVHYCAVCDTEYPVVDACGKPVLRVS